MQSLTVSKVEYSTFSKISLNLLYAELAEMFVTPLLMVTTALSVVLLKFHRKTS